MPTNSSEKLQNVTGWNKKRRSLALDIYYDLGLNKVEQAKEKSSDYAKLSIYLWPLRLQIIKCSLWGNGFTLLT